MDFIKWLWLGYNHSNKYGINYIENHFKTIGMKLWNLDVSIFHIFLKSCHLLQHGINSHVYYLISYKKFFCLLIVLFVLLKFSNAQSNYNEANSNNIASTQSVAYNEEIDEYGNQEQEEEEEEAPEIPLTDEEEKAALLQIKNYYMNLTEGPSFLQGWNETTDPCRNNWPQIICSCDVFGDSTFQNEIEFCDNYEPDVNVSHVIWLEFKDDLFKFSGSINSAFGQLKMLRTLDMSSNSLTGPIPSSFQNLTELRQLKLSQNGLTGTLPLFIGEYANLKLLSLAYNNFSGPIPDEWCQNWSDNNLPDIDIRYNPNLCGKYPECLLPEEVPIYINNGTYLSTGIGYDQNSALCDFTKPICNASLGFRFETPKYWTSPDYLDFNFTNCVDSPSGICQYRFNIKSNETIETDSEIDEILIETAINIHNNPVNLTNNITMEDGTLDTQELHLVDLRLNESSYGIRGGVNYTITLTAVNCGGPPLSTSVVSNPVTVDTTGPVGGEVFNTPEFTTNTSPKINELFGASWQPFIDLESSVHDIEVVLQEIRTKLTDNLVMVQEFINIRSFKVDSSSTKFILGNGNLTVKKAYRYSLSVKNYAGISTLFNSSVFEVQDIENSAESALIKNSNEKLLPIVIVACFLFGCIFIGLPLYIRFKWKRRNKKGSSYNMQYLKEYLHEMMDMKKEDLHFDHQKFDNQTDVTFLVTDLEKSTEQSNYSEVLFRQLSMAHDEIINKMYQTYGARELQKEGDSFQLAFASPISAVKCAIDIQTELMSHKWSKKILKMPGCEVKRNLNGLVMFRGPRVRIGIHCTSYSNKNIKESNNYKNNNHYYIFKDPSAFQLAKDVSDAGNGGQILLTHDAWLMIRDHLNLLGFPIIQQLGFYKFSCCCNPIWVYEITKCFCDPFTRTFGPIRKAELMDKGWGYNIISEPKPNVAEALTFVATKMEIKNSESKLPEDLAETVYDALASHAQIFNGYIFRACKTQGNVVITFADPLNAIRFAHVCQISFLLYDWPETIYNYSGNTEEGSDGFPIFKGPRIAMAIHTTHLYKASNLSEGQSTEDNILVDYWGYGDRFVSKLVECLHGGQVVLSDRIWNLVRHDFPGNPWFLSLGEHYVVKEDKNPILLMEALPRRLLSRKFTPIKTIKQVSPGFIDAPSVDKDMTLVFFSTSKYKTLEELKMSFNNKQVSVKEDKEIPKNTSEDLRLRRAAYMKAVEMTESLVRKRLTKYSGYECKSPERGKICLAFQELQEALQWAVHVQSELLTLDWPERLLEIDDFKTCYDSSGKITQRGLKAKIGMYYGKVGFKHPLNTGSADYYGSAPNLAARVWSLASPGQILFHTSCGFDTTKIQWIKQDEIGVLEFDEKLDKKADGIDELLIEIKCEGEFLLRGVDHVKILYQAKPASLASITCVNKKGEVNQANNGDEVVVTKKGIASRILKKLFGCRLFYRHAKTGLMFISCQNISQDPMMEMTTLDTNNCNRDLLTEGGETRTNSTVSTRQNIFSFNERTSEINGFPFMACSSSHPSGSGQPLHPMQ